MGRRTLSTGKLGGAILALLICALGLGAAVSALGSKGLSRTASTAFPPGTQRAVSATCPRGTHASGGGFQVFPAATPGGAVHSFTTNSTFAGRRTWTVTSGATIASQPANLFARVRCERKGDGRIAILLPGTGTITPDTTPPYDAMGLNLRFTCPPGTRPIAGGYSVDKPFDPNQAATNRFFATQNRRTGRRQWTISGFLYGGPEASTPPAEFTGKVPCERLGSPPVTERSRVVPYTEDARSTASVRCAKGRHLVSGGFAFTPAGPGPIPVPFIDQAIATGPRSWRVSAYDSVFGVPPGSAMSVYAYCRRNQRPRKRRRARRSASAAPAALAPGSVEITPLRAATLP